MSIDICKYGKYGLYLANMVANRLGKILIIMSDYCVFEHIFLTAEDSL